MEEHVGLLSGAKKSKVSLVIIFIAFIISFVMLIIGIALIAQSRTQYNNNNSNNPINGEEYICAAKDFGPNYHPFRPPSSVPKQGGKIAIINGTVWPVTGVVPIYPGCVLMTNGMIEFVGLCTSVNEDLSSYSVYNVLGKYVTPGIVDMHSHLGVNAFPVDAEGTQDTNEMTDPIFPQVRALDALNPEDPAIPLIRSGGVTTSLVLPGSGNVMGGEAVYIKMRGTTVEDMLIPNVPRALKMACGENPKRVYGSRNVTPMTRMGSAWLMRKAFFAAAELKQLQDQWDCLDSVNKTASPRPENLALDPLVALLRNQVNLNVHSYTIEDMRMMIRTANEFGFKISAFHHSLEAWKIPDILAANGITVATFAELWGFKMEAYEASVWAPKILYEHGVNIALKSDHPVTYAKYLIQQAAIAHNYGLPKEAALRSVTLAPAISLGLGNRIGSLETGKEGDVVVWDNNPLEIGAHPDKIFIDGVLIDDFNRPLVSIPELPQVTIPGNCPEGPIPVANFALTGVTVYTMNQNNDMYQNAVIIVENGIIKCLGTCSYNDSYTTYNLQNGIVTPGLINVGAPLGLVEVDQEPNSQDGTAYVADGTSIRAIDGIQLQAYKGRHIKAALAGGVTTIIVPPTSPYLVAGVGVAYNPIGRFIGDTIFGTTNVVKEQTSLHINFGNIAKNGPDPITNSISGQLAALKKLFANSNNDNIIQQILTGEMPFVVNVDQVDEIAAIIKFKQYLGANTSLIILGGAEAYEISDVLAQTPHIGVVLNDITQSMPFTFDTWKASPNSAGLLNGAGVPVAISNFDHGRVRNLRWNAAQAFADGLPYLDALASITRTPAQIFFGNSTTEGTITVGSYANFVAFSGDPLSTASTIQLVNVKGVVSCKPLQY